MIWRLSMPSSDRKSPDNDENFKYKDYGKRVANTVVARHPNAKRIVCVNDVYGHPYSTKEDERSRRGKKEEKSPNEFFKPNDDFPSRKKFNKILQNQQNKRRLQYFLL